jgi:hypothetical protein
MKKILLLAFLTVSLSSLAQKAGDNCMLITTGPDSNPLEKVRDGFKKDHLDALNLTFKSVSEKAVGKEVVVTCKADSEDGPVTFIARVSGGFVLLFGTYGKNNDFLYHTGNSEDLPTYFFQKLRDLAGNPEHMFFPANTIRYNKKNNPWLD